MRPSRIAAFLPALAGALLGSAAFADCEIRAPSVAELEHRARVSAALKEALPAAPAKWTMTSRGDDGGLGLCTGTKPGDFPVTVLGTYVYKPSKEESDALYAEQRKVRKEIDALRELPPQVAKERQGWLDKMSEANRASNAAYKQGDKALARQKSDEADGYSRKGREIRDAYWASVQPKVDALEARAKTLNSGETHITVRIIANERYPRSGEPTAGKPFVAGKVPVETPAMKIQGVRLFVEGPPAKRGEIEAAVDPNKLKRLVQ